MESYGNQVRNMLKRYDRKTQAFFGGPPFSENVDNNIMNFYDFITNGPAPRKRIAMGNCAFDDNGDVVGYWEATVLRNANPTKYEREYIGLEAPLNYFQCKKLLVAPEHQHKGIGRKLMRERFDIAKLLGLPVIVDVNIRNEPIMGLLSLFDFEYQKTWLTPSKVEMCRVRKT